MNETIFENNQNAGKMDTNISIFTEGNPNNSHIIFIHGFPFDHKMWEKQISFFKQSFFCITYDVRGLGVSPAGDGQYTMESFVDDLLFVIKQTNANRPVLCGFSMGGYIALRAVERIEEKFSGLILCDTKPYADDNNTKLKRAEGINKINSEGAAKYVNDFIPNCFSKKTLSFSNKEVQKLIERAEKYDPVGVKGCLLAMAGRTDTAEYLNKMKIPTLVLCGEEDNITPPELMEDFSRNIKNAEFYKIPNSGHLSPFENSEEVNKRIYSFLLRFNN